MTEHEQPPEALLTISDAAQRLHVSTKSVRRWIADGDLTAYRIGKSLIRVNATELDALLRRIPTARGGHHDRPAPSAAVHPVAVKTRAQQICTGQAVFSIGETRWTVPLFAPPAD